MPGFMRLLAAFCSLGLLAAMPATAADPPDFLTRNIDPSVQPGDDLFQHGNGGWIRRNPIPRSESSWGVAHLVREQLYSRLREIHEKPAAARAEAGSDEQKIGDYWRTALDVAKARRLGVAPLKNELAKIDAVASLGQAIGVGFEFQALGSDPFFRVFVQQDDKDSQAFALHAWQGGLGLPDRDFYVNDEPSIRATRVAYVKYLARVLTLLGRPRAQAVPAAEAVMRLETALARAARKIEDTRDPLANYNRIAPADLTRAHTPSVDWVAQLAAWNQRPEFVVVGQPEYFSALEGILREAPLAVLKDYLRLRLVITYSESLGPAFDDANFDFYKRTLSGQKQPKPLWKRIIDAEAGFGSVPDGIGMIVARRFVVENFPERTKRRYAELTRAMVEAYGERIRNLPWMSEATKARALQKLAAVKPKVGYPDRWPDHSALVVGTESHCGNLMAMERWAFERSLARIGKPVDRSEWFMTPQTYNAYYGASNNEIVLPAAVFMIPGVADDDIDDAVVYAYAGASTIGHEITHGFDDSGRHYDAQGNLADWWTAEDIAAFEQRAQRLVRQFDAYEPLPGFRVNGKATLGENIADLGGLAIALDAFRKTEQYRNNVMVAGKTPMQRFFLGWSLAWMEQVRDAQLRRLLLSDVHAPARFRVIGAASNLQEFHEAFGVTKGRRMWRDPEDRVSIW